MQGRQEAGWKQLESAEHVLRATEGKMFRAYTSALLADAHRQSQQIKAGLAAVTEALTHIEQTCERFWEAELYRIKGELTQEIKNQKSKVKGQKSKRGSGNWELGSGFLSSPSPDPQAQSPEPAFAAEECFLKAIAIARQQQAKSLELRATMSLVRFRRRQAEHATWDTQHVSRDNLAQAHSMLSGIYNWFTEGLETKDLQEAKVLLEDLGN